MCCRYYIGDNDPDDVLAEYLSQAIHRVEAMRLPITMQGEVRPTDTAPVIAPGAGDREPGGFPMCWGLPHPTRGSLIFNTRSETADRNPLFAESAQSRRCLIPASYYFEWQKTDGKKVKYAIQPEAVPLYLAGIYFRVPGERLPRFSVLTKEAAPEIRFIHDRMPVIVPPEQTRPWLDAGVRFSDVLAGIAGPSRMRPLQERE